MTVLALLVTACTSGDTTSSDTTSSDTASVASTEPDGSAPTVAGPDADTDPGDGPAVAFADAVGVIDDSASGATASALISGADGGSISVTGSDGTVYTLDVPPGALLADTTITATAAASTEGITGAEQVHSVRLEPDGLQFAGPAALTIVPPTPIPPGQSLGFSATGDGSDPTLVSFDETGVSIEIAHFSIAGILEFLGDVNAIRITFGAQSAESKINSQIAVDLAIRRAVEERGASTDVIDARLKDDLRAYQDQVVVPLIDVAGNTCAGLQRAAFATLNFYVIASRAAIDGVNDLQAIAQDQIGKYQSACEAEFTAQCREANDPNILITFWANVRRMRAFAGMSPLTGTPTDDAKRARRTCTRSFLANGGGAEIVITGSIPDIAKAFTLEGSFAGGTATFSYTPTDDRSGSYTISGGGSGAVLTGSGTYTIEDADPDLIMNQTSSACVSVSGVCNTGIETMNLVPSG
jgi:hypothetical protein